MGGFGSGHRLGDMAKETTATDYPALNVRQLQRSGVLLQRGGLLTPRPWFLHNLTRFGRTVASIEIAVTQNQILLSYGYREAEGLEARNDEYYMFRVSIEWAPCNYGGRRAWFRCPASGCGRRVAILCGNGLFACRHCHQLVYYSASDVLPTGEP